MTREQLFEHLQAIDPALLEQSEKRGRRPRWQMWGAAAACLCLIAAAVAASPVLRRTRPEERPDSIRAGQAQPGEADGGALWQDAAPEQDPENAADGAQENTQTADIAIFYNQLEELPQADGALAAGVLIVGEALTPEELASAAPQQPLAWMSLSGSALYYGWGELSHLLLEIRNDAWGGVVRVAIHDAEKPLPADCLLPEEQVQQTQLGDLCLTAFQYTGQEAGRAYLWAEFARGGLCYHVTTEAGLDGLEQAKADLADVLRCYADSACVPDLDAFHMREAHTWQDATLSPEQALQDADFGAYMLRQLPDGFSEESIRRYQDDDSNFLSGLWTRGYDSLQWRVRYVTEADAARLTSVSEPENYDLSRYPIPRAESVPRQLREIVNDPIFRAEELTLQAVCARAYTVSDAGDSDGWRMNFSVLYDDRIVIEVSSKGLAPEWIYTQLISLTVG